MSCCKKSKCLYRVPVLLFMIQFIAAPVMAVHETAIIEIMNVEPTPLFPRTGEGDPLKQIARLTLNNSGSATDLRVRITMEGEGTSSEPLGMVLQGQNERNIHIPDITGPARLTIEILGQDELKVLASETLEWLPQKKWKLFFVQYSHHDLGFYNYYQSIRRDVREKGLELAMEICRQTDHWPEDEKFRWTIETSELFPGFMDVHDDKVVNELISRIHEGRIEPAAFHNTVSSDFLDFETMARLFYTPNRHTHDMLGIPRSSTGIMSDAVAITWPLTSYAKEADLPYIWHGPNWDATCLIPARDEPVFNWQPPDGDTLMPLVRSYFYWKDNIRPKLVDSVSAEMVEESLCEIIRKYSLQENWVYDALLIQEAEDFSTPDLKYSKQLKEWNSRYAHPRMINATMSMFMEYMDKFSQDHMVEVKTFDKDAPNAWADQEISDSKLLAQARKFGCDLPAAEKFSSIAMAMTGNGYPWTDLWQAYDRLLMYHEHTNGAFRGEDATYYETEKVMHRTLVQEGQEFSDKAMERALKDIEKMISTMNLSDEQTFAVFNSLCHERSDIVHLNTGKLPEHFQLIDNASGKSVVTQTISVNETVFFAENIPSLGYKTYTVKSLRRPTKSKVGVISSGETLENRFYRISFDTATGAISSIIDKELDKELVDVNARWKFNEYLYEKGIDRENVVWQNEKEAKLTGSSGSVRGSMISDIRASGVESIRQEVVLYADIKRIDIVNSMVKSSSGFELDQYFIGWKNAPFSLENREAVYYAFPVGIEDFNIRHQLTGAVIEPISQQFEGSSTSYYTIRHFTSVSNDEFGVTISPVDAPLVEYGRPRHAPWLLAHQLKNDGTNFESIMEMPENSHVYSYLMNNFFTTNVCIDQPGPKTFRWSVTSHPAGWKENLAYEFGRDVANPMITRMLPRGQKGSLPDGSFSFVRIDKPNVMCSTIKMAETNGEGFILRFNELAGEATSVTVSLDFLKEITAAFETNLIEDDRPVPVRISDHGKISFDIRPNGIKTIRVLSAMHEAPPVATNLKATPEGDMQVDLSWEMDPGIESSVSHYDVFRLPAPDIEPGIRYYVGSTTHTRFSDRPRLHFGGWINNKILPETDYYYTVRAVDSYNNRGPLAPLIPVTTLTPDQKNLVPNVVEGLYAVQVSPSGPMNYLHLWFYTNCEPDIVAYEIHRGKQQGFVPGTSTRIATVEMNERLMLLNRQMYTDENVEENTGYYYRIRAVDKAGQRGEFSAEVYEKTQ